MNTIINDDPRLGLAVGTVSMDQATEEAINQIAELAADVSTIEAMQALEPPSKGDLKKLMGVYKQKISRLQTEAERLRIKEKDDAKRKVKRKMAKESRKRNRGTNRGR